MKTELPSIALPLLLFALTFLVTTVKAQAEYNEMISDILAEVNYERDLNGAEPLKLSKELCSMAMDYCGVCARAGYISHDILCDEEVRLLAYSYGLNKNFLSVRELLQTKKNMAIDPGNVIMFFRNSPNHWEWIINESMEYIGIAFLYSGESYYLTMYIGDNYNE